MNRRNVKNEDAKVEDQQKIFTVKSSELYQEVRLSLMQKNRKKDGDRSVSGLRNGRGVSILQEKSVHFVESKKLNMKDLQGGIYFVKMLHGKQKTNNGIIR